MHEKSFYDLHKCLLEVSYISWMGKTEEVNNENDE